MVAPIALSRCAGVSREFAPESPTAREAYAQFEGLGVVYDGEATIRPALAECLLASGDRLAATEVLATATKQVYAWADTIEDPAGRQAYLTRIPEHRRILELVQELAACES